jgi:hypothetical protein
VRSVDDVSLVKPLPCTEQFGQRGYVDHWKPLQHFQQRDNDPRETDIVRRFRIEAGAAKILIESVSIR